MCDLITDLQSLGIAQVRARLTQARAAARVLIDDTEIPEIRRYNLAVAMDEMDARLLDFARNALFHLAGEIEAAQVPVEERVDLDASPVSRGTCGGRGDPRRAPRGRAPRSGRVRNASTAAAAAASTGSPGRARKNLAPRISRPGRPARGAFPAAHTDTGPRTCVSRQSTTGPCRPSFAARSTAASTTARTSADLPSSWRP